MYVKTISNAKFIAKKEFISVSLPKMLNGFNTGIKMASSATIIKRANNDKIMDNAGIKYSLMRQYQSHVSLFIISYFE